MATKPRFQTNSRGKNLLRRLLVFFALFSFLFSLAPQCQVAIACEVAAEVDHCPYSKINIDGVRCFNFRETNVLRFDQQANPKAHLVFIHGLGLCAKAYIPLGLRMSQEGYNSSSIDVRGFGASRKLHKKKLDLNSSVEDVKVLLSTIKASEPKAKIILVGESMGAALAIATAAQAPKLVDGIICSSPAWKVNKRKRLIIKRLFGIFLPKPGPAAKSVMKQATSNPLLLEHWKNDHHHTLRISIGESIAFARFIGKTPRRVQKLNVPVLFIHGLKDQLIKPEGTAKLYKKLNTERKCFVLLQNHEHLILEEGQFDDVVIDTIKNWIATRKCPEGKGIVFSCQGTFEKKNKTKARKILKHAGLDDLTISELIDCPG